LNRGAVPSIVVANGKKFQAVIWSAAAKPPLSRPYNLSIVENNLASERLSTESESFASRTPNLECGGKAAAFAAVQSIDR